MKTIFELPAANFITMRAPSTSGIETLSAAISLTGSRELSIGPVELAIDAAIIFSFLAVDPNVESEDYWLR